MATLIRTTLSKTAGGLRAVASVTIVPSRTIAGRELRKSRPAGYQIPSPFDYKNKDYTAINALYDFTTQRINENSKIIVVEGPIAVGKTEFAKKLSDELGMLHMPEANLDLYYKRPNGMDLREFDPLVPEDVRSYDHTNFCRNPNHRNAAAFQLMTYRLRYSQYVDALTHVLNTGQGVVLERCPYSDFIFLEAMYKFQYVSAAARGAYYDIRRNTIDDLMRPHLVIYLDISVDAVKSRIRERGLPHEVSSRVFTNEYLNTLEYLYKYKYLQDISTHAELLVYDWTGKGEIEVVVEDIERIDFDQYTEREEPKMKDWRLPREMDWCEKRQIFTNGKHYLMNNFNLPITTAPELYASAEDSHAWDSVVLEHPKFKYADGYNEGEGGTLTKNAVSKYDEHL